MGDDMIDSIWNKEPIPSFPALKGDLKTDVLIVGGGMAGILCAYQLARANVDYALIEEDKLCGGVTRNTTAKITAQHGLVYDKLIRRYGAETARLYYRANADALAQFRELANGYPCDFEEKDNLVYMRQPVQALEKEMEALRQLRIPAERTMGSQLPFPVAGAIRFPNQAQFHPLKFAAGIVEGLHIYEHTAAREFIGNRVFTDGGLITASKIIMATHFPIINKHGGYFLKLYQQRSYVLALENAQNVNGMYLDGGEEGLSFRNHGDILLLGGGGHRTGKKGGGWKVLEDFARRYYPSAREITRWATQDCMTLDGIPYIGQYSKSTPNLYVATGFNKWGMSSSMVAAHILTDLVQGKANPYASVFDSSRRIFHPQLFVNGLESAAHLLKPGKPRCPHLGCALEWNPQEHSWDCPCHGSRFAESGKLMDNPATGNLNHQQTD